MDPKGAQMEPRGVKVQPQGHQNYRKSTTCTPRVPQWSPGCYNGDQGPHKCKQKHKKITQIATKTSEGAPRSKKTTKATILTQTTKQKNQPTKETKRNTKKQTIEQTHTQELRTANTNTNYRGRVLAEGEVDPAAGSPKEPFRL